MNEPLSYLVSYWNAVNSASIDSSDINNELSIILATLDGSAFGKEEKEDLQKQKEKILSEIEKFNSMLTDFKHSTTEFLRKEESAYMSYSYKKYKKNTERDTPEFLLDRALNTPLISTTETKERFITRIQIHSTWEHPGMIVRPEHGEYADQMASSDPLYISDHEDALLVPTKKLWNEDYQKRVRYQIIQESRDVLFRSMPTSQLGFIVMMNFLNHKPLDVIKRYLVESYDILKPGGVLLFTYNNCNLPLAVQNFEKEMYSYTPGTLVKAMSELIGYIILDVYDNPDENVSWLELKKPGELTSLRGGQCLAKIQDKRLLPPK
jgi:hypothetical protein